MSLHAPSGEAIKTNTENEKQQIEKSIMMAAPNKIDAEPYVWPINSSISAETTVLVIIDMQCDCESAIFFHIMDRNNKALTDGTCFFFFLFFFPFLPVCAPGGYAEAAGLPIAPMRAIIPTIQSLLAAFRQAGYPIYHTREGPPPRPQHALGTRTRPQPSSSSSSPRSRPRPRPQSRHRRRGAPWAGCWSEASPATPSSPSWRRGPNEPPSSTSPGEAVLHEATVAGIQKEGGIFGAVTDAAAVLAALARE